MAEENINKVATEKYNTGRRRSPKRLIKAIAVLIILSGLIAFLVYSPLFILKHVVINGNSYLTQEEITKIAGVNIGEPLFKLETGEVSQRLLHDLRVESAVVKRVMPDTLEINITERTPLATIACDYGYLDLDRQGKVIASYRNLKKMTIPMITGVKVHDLYVGDDNSDETISQVLKFLAALDTESMNQISEINIADRNAITIYTINAVQIRLGKIERMDEKIKLTQDFLANLKNDVHGIEYVDFSYTAPFIRLRNMPSEVELEVDENSQ